MPSSNDKDKTKQYRVKGGKRAKKSNHRKNINNKERRPDVKKKQNNKNSKKGNKGSKHPKLMMALKIGIIIFLLLCVIGAGVVAGMFFGLFGDEFEITKDELKIEASNSVIVDKNGAVVANLSGDEKRKIIKIEDMADYLPKAYVAIEDERFYKHSGVDIKRTGGAILGKIFGKSSYGGSTITQQLVKNITKDDQTAGLAGIMRKVKEWAKAYQVERMISKDQILELYLNILYVGGEGNLHGVELGAEYYFNKSAKDLDLAECAFLAGINSSPSIYNPYKLILQNDTEEKRNDRIKSKTLTVLAKMKELGYIQNEEEYNAAVAKAEAGLTFEKGVQSLGTSYSYHSDAVIEQVISEVMAQKEISRQLAENYVYSSGLTIYSTVDSTIQTRIEQEALKEKYQLKGIDINKETGEKLNDHTQAAFVVIDHKTGYVIGASGGLGEKTGANLNRATQTTRQPGSSIKPIAVIAPALEEKVITTSTVYNDVYTNFSGYTPRNDGGKYRGLINIRDIIAYSQNVPEVKIMRELTPSKSIDYLRNFGVTSLYKNGEHAQKDDESLPLAIGGISDGISPLEMAAAYATLANNGEYITPTFYTKVVDSNGNTVLTSTQERRRVISEQNAYLVKSILQEPVRKGTATYCAISGMDVAAKTGTTDNSYDRWLCGFTPYYAAACWFGYDSQEEVRYSGTNPAGQIWDAIMTDIHVGLASARFVKPSGIVSATVCKTTGCIATTGCTETYVESFAQNNLPQKCPGHNTQELCKESGLLANEYCPEKEKSNYGVSAPKEQLKLWKAIGSVQAQKQITDTCTVHKKPEEPDKDKDKENEKNNTNKNNTTTKPSTNTTTKPSNNTNTSGSNSGTSADKKPDNDKPSNGETIDKETTGTEKPSEGTTTPTNP